MAILNITTDSIGHAGVDPRIVYILTNDSFNTVTTAGYLSKSVLTNAFQFLNTDIALVSTKTSPGDTVIKLDFLDVSFSNGVWSLTGYQNNVVTPTIVDHIATFLNISGVLTEDPAVAFTGGAIQAFGNVIAGKNATAGNLQSYTATLNKGSLILKSTNNTGNFVITLTNKSHGQSTVYTYTDPAVANASILSSSIASADISPNLITFDVSIPFSAIQANANVPLAGTGAVGSQYRIYDLFINKGSNLAGGDRDIAIGNEARTQTFSIIPTATVLLMVNQRWGGSAALPFPASIALQTAITSGSKLIANYNSGTTDYTSGSITINGILERIT